MSRNMMIFVAVIFIVLFMAIFKVSQKNLEGMSHKPVAPNPESATTPGFVPTVPQVQGQKGLPTLGPGPGMIEKYSRSRIVSEQATKEFTDISRVQMKFPDNFKFQQLDLDFEQITGIYAHTEKMDVSVLSGRVLPTEKEVIEFLRSKDSGIPNIDGKGVTLKGDAIEVPALSGSGLKRGKYWAGRTSDNKGVRIGLAERTDGKGSYLFVFTGPEDKLDNSEDFFEELYQNLKALP